MRYHVAESLNPCQTFIKLFSPVPYPLKLKSDWRTAADGLTQVIGQALLARCVVQMHFSLTLALIMDTEDLL